MFRMQLHANIVIGIERVPVESIGKASARQVAAKAYLFGVNEHAATDWRIGSEDDVGCSHGAPVRPHDHAGFFLHCALGGRVTEEAAASLGDRARQAGEIFQGMKASRKA